MINRAKLKELRGKFRPGRPDGYTQKELAIKVGVSVSTIRALEQAVVSNPTIDVVVQLSRVLECDIEDLLLLTEM